MIATNGVYEPAVITKKKRKRKREQKTYPEDDRNERRVRASNHHENHGSVEAIEHLV